MILSQELALAIRFLSIDAVEKAQSGHPGMPLGMADIATVLWHQFLKHQPKNPSWFNRDRFVLSNGHGSMLLYALLHLTGYSLSLEDIQQFRQLGSKTPGHPECTHTPGVETTTGPLGQGLANAVGMALAEKVLATRFNQPELALVDHYTYVFAGDGCLMEGISHEACSLAGTLGLGKLIVFYDDNGISIDGNVHHWFTDNTAERFRAYQWHVIEQIDGHNPAVIQAAILEAQQEKNRPTLIICKTIIGYGTELAGSEKSHGAPLGDQFIQEAREHLKWVYAPFVIPEYLYAEWNHVEQGKQEEFLWLQICQEYQNKHPRQYQEFLRQINGDLPDTWQAASEQFIIQCQKNNKSIATRKASQLTIEAYAPHLPELFGGSADLTSSNNTDWSGTKPIEHDNFSGNYLHYGVREFGMSAMMTGMALHGGFIPYGGTFLVFSDYARNAIRLCAMMKQRVVFIYSHDSIGLGEDGPTHQPIEQAASLRMIPNLEVWRPADLMETAVAWQQALQNERGPSCILLSRQALPALPHATSQHVSIQKGGYILIDSQKTPDAIIIATGSEMSIALTAAQRISAKGKQIRVVSMPCAERFLMQDEAYRHSVLPPNVRTRLAIEAGCTTYWHQFVGLDGAVMGVDQFGASAPAEKVFESLGLTAERAISLLNFLLEHNVGDIR